MESSSKFLEANFYSTFFSKPSTHLYQYEAPIKRMTSARAWRPTYDVKKGGQLILPLGTHRTSTGQIKISPLKHILLSSMGTFPLVAVQAKN